MSSEKCRHLQKEISSTGQTMVWLIQNDTWTLHVHMPLVWHYYLTTVDKILQRRDPKKDLMGKIKLEVIVTYCKTFTFIYVQVCDWLSPSSKPRWLIISENVFSKETKSTIILWVILLQPNIRRSNCFCNQGLVYHKLGQEWSLEAIQQFNKCGILTI